MATLASDQVEDFAPTEWIKGRAWLIQQNDVRVTNQSRSNPESLQHPS